jgi:hypothetical protein
MSDRLGTGRRNHCVSRRTANVWAVMTAEIANHTDIRRKSTAVANDIPHNQNNHEGVSNGMRPS